MDKIMECSKVFSAVVLNVTRKKYEYNLKVIL
jgi:hypothetical protein